MARFSAAYYTEKGTNQMPLILRFALLLILFLVPAGCQRRNADIAGVTVPIPSQMQKLPDKAFDPIPGFEDGQTSFQGKITADEIISFYQENMEARGWKPTTFMGGNKNQFTYTKDNRICLVWYTENNDGTTTLTLMVGTLNPPK
jgi:hypothetical protein